ncbi:MAG TPA: hypothetical protein VFN55_04680 [Solirubrobacteraceae bacterium]|nr:hypothetical protein [Solirubrobacteraceae bacterium]
MATPQPPDPPPAEPGALEPPPPDPPPAEPGALDEARIAVYTRLLDAQDTIAQDRYAHGVGDEAVQAALDAADQGPSAAERREDLYVSALAHYVRALGGRLEIHAVFAESAVVLDPGRPEN